MSIENGPDITTNSLHQVLYRGTPIGTLVSFQNRYPMSLFVVDFNSQATPERVQALIRSVVIHVRQDSYMTIVETAYLRLYDRLFVSSPPHGKNATLSKQIQVTPVNDAPVLGGIGGTVNYQQGNEAINIAPNAVVYDSDSANLNGGVLTVQVSAGVDARNRIELAGINYAVDASNNVRFTPPGYSIIIGRLNANGGIGVTKFEITFTSEDFYQHMSEDLLQEVTFRTSGVGSTQTRDLTITLSDGDGGLSTPVMKSVIMI